MRSYLFTYVDDQLRDTKWHPVIFAFLYNNTDVSPLMLSGL